MPAKRKPAAAKVEPTEASAEKKIKDGDEDVVESISNKAVNKRGKKAAAVPEKTNAKKKSVKDKEDTPPEVPKEATNKRGKRQPTKASKINDQPSDKSEDEEEDEEKQTPDVPKETVKRQKRQLSKAVSKVEEEPSDKSEEEEEETTVKKSKTGRRGKQDDSKEAPKGLLNQTETAYAKISFTCDKQNKLGKTSNFCIASWNVDGLRAWLKKDGLTYLKYEKPDVFCIQESKCSTAKLPPEVSNIQEYKQYWHNSSKEGYAGVGLFTLSEPISVQYGVGDEEHDDEGRCITAEFENFYVITVYVPNAGRKLITLPKRLEWNIAFKKFVKNLDEKKPVIICGDMNVAHSEIDLANPKTNTKNAGFTKEERDGMTDFLADGYVDTFRSFYPELKDAYTFWSYMSKARTKNIGWRLDYFIVSERFMDNICDNVIRSEIFGSDHCPLSLFLNV